MTTPVFECVRVRVRETYDRVVEVWEFWCEPCRRWHRHSPEAGHRGAHCVARWKPRLQRWVESPWMVGGYVLVEAGEVGGGLTGARPVVKKRNQATAAAWLVSRAAVGVGGLMGARKRGTLPGGGTWTSAASGPPAGTVACHGVAVKDKAGVETVLYQPTAKQLTFHLCPARNILYGGAVAGGKSHGLRWDAHMACLSVPGIRVLILRRTFPELQDTHLDRVGVEAQRMGAEYLKSEYRVRFPNGSVEQYGHCGDDAAVGRYLSTEYERIYFDELVTFTFRQFVMIGSRARSTKPGYIPRVLAATNPGGPHAAWVREWFIDKTVDRGEYPAYRADDYAYIPATLDDNPHIEQAVYEHRLSMLPPALREAYRHGSWDIFEGQYFKEWKARDHVAVIEEVPASTVRFRALDWGYLRPGVCLWLAMLPDGHLYIEEEYVFSETIASEVAREIRRRSAGRKLGYTVADPAMWIRDGQSGESIAETFARGGVPLLKADHDRINGWQRLRHWLRLAPDGKPWLQVSPACPYLSRTLPGLLMDAHRPEDVDTDGEDHAADALRYGVMSRPAPRTATETRRAKPGTAGALLAALRPPHRTRVGSTNARRVA